LCLGWSRTSRACHPAVKPFSPKGEKDSRIQGATMIGTRPNTVPKNGNDAKSPPFLGGGNE